MTDKVVDAIENGRLTSDAISFDSIRGLAGHDHSRYRELGFGREILQDEDLLDQYLYSYGLIIKRQWVHFLQDLDSPAGPLLIVDYGCGQGLGTAFLFDHFGEELRSRVEELRLIEPSALALTRAEAILSCYCPSAKVVAINRGLDQIDAECLQARPGSSTLHVMSNILDVDTFDPAALFSSMLRSTGRHDMFAVSHDRDFEGGSTRFTEIEKQVHDAKFADWFQTQVSNMFRFEASDGRKAIGWHLQVDVK